MRYNSIDIPMSDNFQVTNKSEKRTFTAIFILIVIGLLIVVGKIAYPNATRVIFNIVWFFFLSVVLIFLGLGSLVMLGLRKEVHKILDLLLEGTLTLLDFIEFIKKLWVFFIIKLQEFIYFIAPYIAYLLTLLIYLLLLVVYKSIGSKYDVTLLTGVLTVVLMIILGLFNSPEKNPIEQPSWSMKLGKRFKHAFSDGFEVIVFIFFLTLDSTDLFFLPAELNVPMHAQVMGYDLMIRGFYLHDARFTLTLATIAISVEIVRRSLRLILAAIKHYRSTIISSGVIAPRLMMIKNSIRVSVKSNQDDLIKFITFNTVLLFVFLLFPRLKLLSLALASITNLAMDIWNPSSMTISSKEESDLITKIICKVFKL